MPDRESLESPTEDPADDEPQTLLDRHQDFVRSIDDASRIGYSVLGSSTLVIPVLVVLISGVKLVSFAALGIFLGSAVLVLILGRRLALARQDRHLRSKVTAYCDENNVELVELIKGGLAEDRYEFFIKLFLLGKPNAGEAPPE